MLGDCRGASDLKTAQRRAEFAQLEGLHASAVGDVQVSVVTQSKLGPSRTLQPGSQHQALTQFT